MSLRFQRLFVILFSLIFITFALILILNNSKKNIIFFYTPTELYQENELNNKIRIGGYVKENSIQELNSKDSITFIITDNKNVVKVIYSGVLPDLFSEGRGVIARGRFDGKIFIAEEVLAKHDEKYMPRELKKILDKDLNY